MSLVASDLRCGYAGRVVLDNLSFEIKPGEVVVLLGPNGSGKSTLLKTLINAVPPLAGEVRLAGQPVSQIHARAIAAMIAFVPQEEHSTFPFPARQIAMMGRIPHSRGFGDTADDHAVVERALAEADCLDYADRPITELSGGERQRVLIARALASEAQTLLLDEPSSHLDAAHVVSLVRLLRRLAADGKAVVAAIHDLNVASILGDRALLLGQGKIMRDAAVGDVLRDDALQTVYGIEFLRMDDPDGNLRVFPKL